MGLEIYSENKQKLLNLNDEDILYLESNVLEKFNDKYYNLFDLYSDFRLYKNHQECLIEIITNLKNKPKFISEFAELLNASAENDKVLIVIGN